MPVRGIRGATTATGNTREAVLDATRELLGEMIAANGLDADDVASAWFTTSPGIDDSATPIHGFRIVHVQGTSPRLNQGGNCSYPKSFGASDMHLKYFTGPD